MWDGYTQEEWLQPRSTLEITHEDFSGAIAAHPHLLVFLTGNARGIICMWGFQQS
jgi:hypothetical protein